MQNKKYTYQVQIELNCINIETGFCAYRLKTFKNAKISEEIEGISTLENINNYDPFNNVLIKNANLHLCHNDVKELIRHNTFSTISFKDFIINNPYTYLKEIENKDIKNKKDYNLYNISVCDHTLRDLNDNILPQAIYFDYMSAGMDNKYYDLNLVLEILKKRTDIEFIQEKEINKNIEITKEPKILNIPYYNSSDSRNKYLKFKWMPSNEDFSKLLSNKKRYPIKDLSIYDYIVQEIFGIPKKTK